MRDEADSVGCRGRVWHGNCWVVKYMKRTIQMLAAALCCTLAFTACHKDNPSEPQEPEVEEDTTPVGACVECEFKFSESTFSLFDVTFEFLNEDGTVTSEQIHDLKVEKKFTSYSFPCEMGARFSIALKEGLVLSAII